MFRDLYKLLDEKDEEIHIVTRLNEQLKGKFIFKVFLENLKNSLNFQKFEQNL